MSKRLSPGTKDLLMWKASNFGYEVADSTPTMRDMNTLAKDQTILVVPMTVKKAMLSRAILAYKQRRHSNPSLPKGKWIKVSHIKLNRNGSISIRGA